MKKINHKILMPIIFCFVMIGVYFINREKPQENEAVIESTLKFNSKVEPTINDDKNKSERMDINLVDESDLKSLGFSDTVSKKIIEYRELIGTIEELSELKNIKGIGSKTYEKIRDKVTLDKKNVGEKIKLNINKADEYELGLYGFNKKDIKKIIEWKETKGTIFSNIDLIEIVGDRKYDEIKNLIIY